MSRPETLSSISGNTHIMHSSNPRDYHNFGLALTRTCSAEILLRIPKYKKMRFRVSGLGVTVLEENPSSRALGTPLPMLQ